jgi:hypothetical protein
LLYLREQLHRSVFGTVFFIDIGEPFTDEGLVVNDETTKKLIDCSAIARKDQSQFENRAKNFHPKKYSNYYICSR